MRDRVATALTVVAMTIAIPIFLLGLSLFWTYINNPRGWCDPDASPCGDWSALSGVVGYLSLTVSAVTLYVAIRRNERRYSMLALASLLLPVAALALPIYEASTAPVWNG
jgi:hypothetical protein